MQAISNMENDLGYSKRKAETGNRRGLPRATTMGWISNHAAEWAIRMAAVLALINTAALIYFGGWPFALVGVASPNRSLLLYGRSEANCLYPIWRFWFFSFWPLLLSAVRTIYKHQN